MIVILDNPNYRIVVENITQTNHENGEITVSGWAVDKLRRSCLALSIKNSNSRIERQLRSDLISVFQMDSDEEAGFIIATMGDTRRIDLVCQTKWGDFHQDLDLKRLQSALRKQQIKKRVMRVMSLFSRLWTPRGIQSLKTALKRRVVKKHSNYETWIKANETMSVEEAKQEILTFQTSPLISIVTPVYNVDEKWLRKCVESMQNQWYANWELCLADDCSTASHVRPLLRELAKKDERIKIMFRQENGRIAQATNSALTLASGDFIGFMDNDDELAPQALFEVARAINSNSQADFIYTDEDKITESGVRFDPFFKPGFSPNLLLGHNYITHFVVVSKGLLEKVGGLQSEFDGSQDYDFVLRATEKANRIIHLPKMLYHWRVLPSSVAGNPRSKMYAYEAGRKAIIAALKRRHLQGSVRMLENLGTYKIDYHTDLPSVAVFVSSLASQQFETLQELTDYPKVVFISTPYASRNTAALKRLEDCFVFLDGVLPNNKNWLREMVNYSVYPTIGVVGGKIFDLRERVVNAGITLRALRTSQPFELRGQWDDGIGYYFRDLLPREMFAVTEECMLTKRSDFIEVKGFSEGLAKGISGIDYCQKIYHQLEKVVLWQPYSVFQDKKSHPLMLSPDSVREYLKLHSRITDPFAAANFPPNSSNQAGIKYSFDSVERSNSSSDIRIIGWAADARNQEQVNIELLQPSTAEIVKKTRCVRNDVNEVLSIPPDEEVGFLIDISCDSETTEEKLSLVLKTSTDCREVQVGKVSSRVRSRINRFLHVIWGIRHPRTFYRRISDRYLEPRREKAAYQKLVRNTEQYNESEVRSEISELEYKPLISLVIPVYNVEPRWLDLCIKSVTNQYYENWELCLADDCSTQDHVRPLLEQYTKMDSRIKTVFRTENGHISRATNSALALATGEFVGLMDNDDELAPQALFEVAKILNEFPEVDLIYSDEDKEDESGRRSDPHFKPDYSPDLLLSTNYISHFAVYRKSIIDELGGFRVGYEGSQDYDLVLRFVAKTSSQHIKHIPKVLYHWRTLATSTASGGNVKGYASDAGLRALKSALVESKQNATALSSATKGIYRVHYNIDNEDLVSVIIPTKNGYDNIERCVSSIIEKTTYSNYEIIIADNGSTNTHMFELYQRFEQQLGHRFRVESIDIPFNFSRINNLAAQKAKGKYLLFLNDDTEVISKSWMTRMVSFAQLTRIGVVGAKLIYPTGTIQHAGIVLGMGGVAGHIMAGFPRGYVGYFGRLIENVNYYAVTAACCMVKASDFREVGGFDEDLAVAYNDVDLCIRIHNNLGRDNIFANEVQLYHYESQTRGYDTEDAEKMKRLQRESAKFAAKYQKIIDNDPYYNPNLSRTSGNFWIREE